jgi:hypothetical protein
VRRGAAALYNRAPFVRSPDARSTGGSRVPRFAAVVPALLLALALAGPASRPSPATAAAVMLADSTLVDRWTLPNGLRVVTRTIRGSGVAAITVGYRFGRNDDPAGRNGLAQLLGELAFMGPAGDIPARTIGDRRCSPRARRCSSSPGCSPRSPAACAAWTSTPPRSRTPSRR